MLFCTKHNGSTSKAQQNGQQHNPYGTLALPKSHSSANRPQQAQLVKGKSPKGSKQPDEHCGASYNPYMNPPEIQINKPKYLEELSPESSKQLDVNSMPWCPSTGILVAEASLGVLCSPAWYIGMYCTNGCMLPLFSSWPGTNIVGSASGESGRCPGVPCNHDIPI